MWLSRFRLVQWAKVCHRFVLIRQNPPPPPGKSNIPLLLAGVGVLAGGAAYLFYGTDGTPRDTAKELGSKARGIAAAAEGKAGLRHSQADYQKVYDRIAEVMEKEDYDGKSYPWHCRFHRNHGEALTCATRWIARSGPDPIGVALLGHVRQGRQDGWLQLCHDAIQARVDARRQQWSGVSPSQPTRPAHTAGSC